MALRAFQPAVHVPVPHELSEAAKACHAAANWLELAGMDFEARVVREARQRALERLLALVPAGEGEDGE